MPLRCPFLWPCRLFACASFGPPDAQARRPPLSYIWEHPNHGGGGRGGAGGGAGRGSSLHTTISSRERGVCNELEATRDPHPPHAFMPHAPPPPGLPPPLPLWRRGVCILRMHRGAQAWEAAGHNPAVFSSSSPPQRLSPPSLKARGSPKKEEGGPRDFTWGAWPPCPAKEKWRVALFPTSLVHEVQTGPGWTMADGDRSLHTTRRPWPAHTHTHGARWLVAAGRLGPTCHALTHSSLSPQCTETRPLVVG